MRKSDEQGAAAVEMALIMPLLFLLLFGIIVFGLQLFRLQSMEAAVREGGRVAAVRADVDTIKARVMAEQRVISSPVESDFTWQFVLDDSTYLGSGADAPCSDSTRGQVVLVGAELAEPASYAFTLPFFGDVAPSFVTSAAFRCE